MSDDAKDKLELTVERIASFLEGFDLRETTEYDQKVNALRIINMASQRCMLDVVREEGTSEKYQEMLVQIRHNMLRELWAADLLDTPWALVVDREFPGKPPGQTEFEVFTVETAEALLENHNAAKKLARIQQELSELVNQHNYLAQGDDADLFAELVALISVMGVRSEGADITPFRRAASQVIERSSDPDHPFWEAVLRKYFQDT